MGIGLGNGLEFVGCGYWLERVVTGFGYWIRKWVGAGGLWVLVGA